jgi:DNA-binding transcriptional ArsR family regulator
MPRSQRRRTELAHPERNAFDVLDVLHALSDPTRMTIVATLRADPERACGTFPVDVAPSTLTHHFRVLREAGVIRQREDGNRRWTTLRAHDLNARFPGLLDAIMTAYGRQITPVRVHRDHTSTLPTDVHEADAPARNS